MSIAARLLKKSGTLDSNNLKAILNDLILSFFNKNLKNEQKNMQYYELAKKYEISIIAEEYID